MKDRDENNVCRPYPPWVRRWGPLIFPAVVLLCILFVVYSSVAKAESLPITDANTRAMVERVNLAAERMEREDALILVELNKEGARWHKPDSFVFVMDGASRMRVKPMGLLAGLDSKTRDLDRRPIKQQILEAANREPGGAWVHHQVDNPRTGDWTWVSTYVRRVAGPSRRVWVVGSYVLDAQPERVFARDLMNQAVHILQQQGVKKGLRSLKAPMTNDDMYVFVHRKDGKAILNSLVPINTKHRTKVANKVRGYLKARDRGWLEFYPRGGRKGRKLAATFRSVSVGKAKYVVGAAVRMPVPKGAAGVPIGGYSALIDFVRKASTKVENEGRRAFADFHNKKYWHEGDTYVFVWGADGTRLVYPPDPGVEGMGGSGIKDEGGKPLLLLFREAVLDRGEGWAHYRWSRPGQDQNAWKSAYIRKVQGPDGQTYLVGSGLYNIPMRKEFLSGLNTAASDLLRRTGPAGYRYLRDATGPYRFKEAYVRVFDLKGNELVNGAYPDMEGVQRIHMRDAGGKDLFPAMLQAAENEKGGWVNYRYRPHFENETSDFSARVRKVRMNGHEILVVSGLYVE